MKKQNINWTTLLPCVKNKFKMIKLVFKREYYEKATC